MKTLAGWIAARTVVDSAGRIPVREAYGDYVRECGLGVWPGRGSISVNRFSREVRRILLGVEVRHIGGAVFCGLRWRVGADAVI